LILPYFYRVIERDGFYCGASAHSPHATFSFGWLKQDEKSNVSAAEQTLDFYSVGIQEKSAELMCVRTIGLANQGTK
jgi:hypothetical protein